MRLIRPRTMIKASTLAHYNATKGNQGTTRGRKRLSPNERIKKWKTALKAGGRTASTALSGLSSTLRRNKATASAYTTENNNYKAARKDLIASPKYKKKNKEEKKKARDNLRKKYANALIKLYKAANK